MATSVSGASKYQPKPQEGFSTTTSGTVSSGGVTVGLNSTGNYSNGDTGVWIIDPGVAGKEQSFTGVVDTGGVQVTGVVWTSGTNVSHASGATVVDYVTTAHIHLLSAGAAVSHNADGTPKTGITYPASTFTTPTITDFTNADHTHASTAQGGQLGFSALLATIFSGQVVSASNAGTGGGDTNFLNLGGLKICWGLTAISAQVPTNGQVGLAVTFPTTFAGAPKVFLTCGANTADNRVGLNVSGITTSTLLIGVDSFNAGSTVQTTAYWLAIGT